MGRNFYLYPNKRGQYIVEILNPEMGARVCFRTTGTKNRDEAAAIVGKWLAEGIPARKRGRAIRPLGTRNLEATVGLSGILKSIEKTTDLDMDGAQQIAEALRTRGLLTFNTVKPGPGNVDFIHYLKGFWDFEHSLYVKERLAHNHRISKRYCYECERRVGLYWNENFQDRTLSSITRAELKAFSLSLAGKGFSAGYLNMVLNAGFIPLSYAAKEGFISQNPAAGMERFSSTGPGRGCLTPLEAKQIFSLPWTDKRAFVGNILAASSGLRIGEILALRATSIDSKQPILHITHSWSGKDGLKEGTKNGLTRKVPVLAEVKAMLLELLADNPHGEENPFIFWGEKPDSPSAEGDFLRWGLKAALEQAGIDYKTRKITFHSHRHFFCSRLADLLDKEKVQRVSGHLSEAAFNVYADHVIDENVFEVGKAAEQVFQNILQFPAVKQGA